MIGLAGCDNSQDSNASKELTILTEERLESDVRNYTHLKKEENLDIQIQTLATDKEKREAEIQKLHVEIMAGNGSDFYILDAPSDSIISIEVSLFENPSQIMESGVFAPLDAYIKKDAYWKNGTYKKEFLEAGQYDGKQYILPFSAPVLLLK